VAVAHDESTSAPLRLRRALDPERDHVRGTPRADSIVVVGYQDFLCPYCRRLRPVMRRLRETLEDRLVYVFRYFPLERANPGAELAARAAEAAGRQGRFFEMHDRIFDHELPVGRDDLTEAAREIGLDIARFERDLDSGAVRARVDEDVSDGRDNGVTGTPTMFVDGVRYDGAWDYHSMLESLERPFAARVGRSARVFASLPTSAGLILLIAAVLALVLANSPLGPLYERVMSAEIHLGANGHAIALTTREWLAEGLLSFFFLIVGLEIRRELTAGALANRRAALLPAIAAVGGVVTPALIYLLINRGPSAAGWPIPTATDVAFSLALLAVLGERIPIGLRVFVATLAVADDMLSIAVIAIYLPGAFEPVYSVAVVACVAGLIALNRARVYASWPYVLVGIALWLSLHVLGVHAALTGVLLAICIPGRPSPSPAPLLAQAATALAALDHVDKEAQRVGREAELEQEPVWEWAARNLSATTQRLLSPAERIERAVAPWSAFVILPLFAFSATGVSLAIDFSSPDAYRILGGTVAGLAIGKPVGILAATALAAATGLVVLPEGVTRRQFLGAACLCGVGDTLSLLMADRAFAPEAAAVAKLGVLAGSAVAGMIGMAVLYRRATAATPARVGDSG
jgi:NhaA family Na+:H+ antiporter